MDISANNATFVQMAGSTRFNHFATEAVIDIFSRRQIRMWFILDRDERDDDEIKRMSERLGPRAKVVVLAKRELENYLLDPETVLSLIKEKKASASDKDYPSLGQIENDIKEVAEGLLNRTIQLCLEKRYLRPLYAKYGGNSVVEKLDAMSTAAKELSVEAEGAEKQLEEELGRVWSRDALARAPGSEILQGVLQKYKLSYNKEKDAQRLSRAIAANWTDSALKKILGECTAESEG